MNQYTVIYSSDNRGVQPLGVAVYSLFKHAEKATTYHVIILSNGISEISKARLASLPGKFGNHAISFIETSHLAELINLPSTGRWPIATWIRVFIPDILPDLHGVVLYLDIDTLVCQDLSSLFSISLNGKAIGVVLEHLSSPGSHFNERLQIPQDCPGYFNAGVMLMDIDIFRAQGLVEKVMRHADIHRDHLFCLDQDALNSALCDNLQPIHHKWNWHDGLTRLMLRRTKRSGLNRGATIEDSVESALRPGILHYQGGNKPWRYNYRIEGPRYEKVLAESGFGEYPLPERTFRKWIKKKAYAPLYWLVWAKLRRYDRFYQQLRARQPDNH